MFKKYQHIERFGTVEVENIQYGVCYIFPKIDGTNSSVWLENLEIKAGSRTRQLDLEQDNADFYKSILQEEKIAHLLLDYPFWRIFGEWLVPHTLKTYRQDSWRKFYVFDIMIEDSYLHYEEYAPILESYEIEFIRPLAIINNPSYDQLIGLLDTNTYLIEDGKGSGEGIIIKNYDYQNKFGRQTWAKIVRSEFKDSHRKEMGVRPTNGEKIVESEIINSYCTKELIEKVYAKIVNENGGWSSKKIPQLLNVVYYDLIKEETWDFIKEYKFPIINFKALQFLCVNKIKETKPELF